MSETCKHCGSDKIIPDAVVIDRSSVGNLPYEAELQIRLSDDRRPEPLHAHVCGECGYVQLRAEGAQKLYQRYLATQGK